MKKLLILLLALSPLALLASEGGETDILQRTVNFVIFIAILYYLLADKAKAFFADRTAGIQAQLDKVQDTLKASQQKVEDAEKTLEESRVLASSIIEEANESIASIKDQVAASVESDIAHLSKSFEDKIENETRKVKNQVVEEVLNELLQSDNIELSQDDLANIVLKKVA
ncbi:MAG: F0F1 ATP synthase subunit B [Campylobacterota bacterium]|nr:F0F1 ATP synthase subunit B [Campylobacterota bacterium]